MIDINYFSGGDMTYWQSYEVMYPTLLQYVETFVKEYMWATLLAEKYDIELNEDDLALVESSMTQQREMYGEEYETLLAQAGLTDELLVRLTTADVLSERVYQELLGKEGAMLRPTDEELKNTALTDYVRVHHVLVNYDHFSGLEGYENATEEELKQAALDLANELLEKINNGEDLYAISQEYGDDPGMENNVNGYYFTYGKMVEPFEKASFALEVGGVSGLVETDYGYHIIQRLEQADYIEANWETVSDSILSDEFNVIINDVMENAKVEYCDEYANINYASIK